MEKEEKKECTHQWIILAWTESSNAYFEDPRNPEMKFDVYRMARILYCPNCGKKIYVKDIEDLDLINF